MSEIGLKAILKIHERRYIYAALKLFKGNKRNAAKILEIGLSSLYRKMKELKIIDAEVTGTNK